MSWYQALVPHDRIRRGQVVWLEDTEDVKLRVSKGLLEAADEPAWHAELPVNRRIEEDQ